MRITTESTYREAATRDLLRAMMGVKTWLRETQHASLAGYSVAALFTLSILERHEPARVSDVAEIAQVDVSVVSRQASLPEHEGLVERTSDPDDRRAHRLSVSEKGAHTLEDSRRQLDALVVGRLQTWSDQDIMAFSTTLRRLVADLTITPTSQGLAQ